MLFPVSDTGGEEGARMCQGRDLLLAWEHFMLPSPRRSWPFDELRRYGQTSESGGKMQNVPWDVADNRYLFFLSIKFL